MKYRIWSVLGGLAITGLLVACGGGFEPFNPNQGSEGTYQPATVTPGIIGPGTLVGCVTLSDNSGFTGGTLRDTQTTAFGTTVSPSRTFEYTIDINTIAKKGTLNFNTSDPYYVPREDFFSSDIGNYPAIVEGKCTDAFCQNIYISVRIYNCQKEIQQMGYWYQRKGTKSNQNTETLTPFKTIKRGTAQFLKMDDLIAALNSTS